MTTQHIGELTPARRYALLAATAIRLESMLNDATLSMFDKLMGSLARKAERRTEAKTLRSVRELRAHLRTLATACHAVIAARNERRDPIAAIELQMPWPRFVKCVNEAHALAAPETADARTELLSKYATVRSFAPALLDTFSFQGGHTAASLLKALDVLREMWRTGKRSLPADVPTGFHPPILAFVVLRDGVIDRRAYAMWALSIEAVSRQIGIEPFRLEQWRERALAALDAGLKDRAEDDPLQAGLGAARVVQRSVLRRFGSGESKMSHANANRLGMAA